MTEPRDVTYLVPADVLAEVNAAVTVLETYGPAVTEALRQLDRATTVGRRPTGWCPASTCQGHPPTTSPRTARKREVWWARGR